MASPPTLSVVLPNYNHAKLLPRAVGALLTQELAPDEIIIVDDGSTDDSLAVIRRLAASAPSIRIIVNETNKGVIPSLQAGLREAHGRYVYFAASDDWVMPGFFLRAVKALEDHPRLGLACGESLLVDGVTDRPVGVRPVVRPAQRAEAIDPARAAELLRRIDNWILTGSTVFRRDAVLWSGGFDQDLGSFADGYMARKIALTYGFHFDPHLAAIWAVFPDSVSRKTALEPERARHYLEVVPSRMAADPVFPPWYPDLFRSRWRFGTSRLTLEGAEVDRGHLLAMGAPEPQDRAVLERIWRLPSSRLARLATLAWLWYRWRPTTLRGIARTALAFRMRRFRTELKKATASSGGLPVAERQRSS